MSAPASRSPSDVIRMTEKQAREAHKLVRKECWNSTGNPIRRTSPAKRQSRLRLQITITITGLIRQAQKRSLIGSASSAPFLSWQTPCASKIGISVSHAAIGNGPRRYLSRRIKIQWEMTEMQASVWNPTRRWWMDSSIRSVNSICSQSRCPVKKSRPKRIVSQASFGIRRNRTAPAGRTLWRSFPRSFSDVRGQRTWNAWGVSSLLRRWHFQE